MKSWVLLSTLLSRVVMLRVGVESFEFVWQAIDDVPKTGFGFACSLAFMLVLDVLPWLFLVSFCVVFSEVCRRCCYMIATWVMLGLVSLALLVGKLLAELFGIVGLWQAVSMRPGGVPPGAGQG
jgi:hypothetical protein